MKIVYTDEATKEINDAVDYLIGKSAPPSIVDDLQSDVNAAEDLLLQFPRSSPPAGHGMRKCLLNKFAYQLIYSVEGDVIRVYAFAHLSRRPNYWRSRVSSSRTKTPK